MGRCRECQQRCIPESVQIYLTIHVGEEVYYYSRSDAFFIAKQEDLFHLADFLTVHREDDLVNDMLPQQFPQLRSS